MNKLYIGMVLSFGLYASEENRGGKLPSDFKFRDVEEYKEDVEYKRISFMSQWREYQNAKEEEIIPFDDEPLNLITPKEFVDQDQKSDDAENKDEKKKEGK